ncbi:MAG: flagellar protein [Lachnospiraceae bacterium]|jgi:flagellar operon protein (TIGR03826 family)|nr:flagellar protein [Lachnospiraceae bacterium]
MDVRNCRSCGRLFNYIGGPQICQACRDKLEVKFQQVKNFIRENPQASIQDICDANEVSVQQLHQWVREERLQFSKDSPIHLECENCGAIIYTGRFCDNCKASMANNLTKAFHKEEPKKERPNPFAQETDRLRFMKHR